VLDLRRGATRPARAAGRGDHTVALPVDPMHGTVGVAAAWFEARSSLVPDAHGDNMDTVPCASACVGADGWHQTVLCHLDTDLGLLAAAGLAQL